MKFVIKLTELNLFTISNKNMIQIPFFKGHQGLKDTFLPTISKYKKNIKDFKDEFTFILSFLLQFRF